MTPMTAKQLSDELLILLADRTGQPVRLLVSVDGLPADVMEIQYTETVKGGALVTLKAYN